MKTIVKHISINKGMTVNELVNQMSNSGVFGAGRISKAVDIFESMAKDKNCMVFLGQAGAMVPGGMKNILIDMLKNKYIDVFVTTGATLTHDMAESIGYKHFRGLSDIDDSKLNDWHSLDWRRHCAKSKRVCLPSFGHHRRNILCCP